MSKFEYQDRPTIHTTDTGGLWYDPKELFTTREGRAAVRALLGHPVDTDDVFDGAAGPKNAAGDNVESGE